jgi:hypothetical protein
MRVAHALAWLAAGTGSSATNFTKEKAGIEAIAHKAKANLLARLPKDDCWEEQQKLGCTPDKLVYRKE